MRKLIYYLVKRRGFFYRNFRFIWARFFIIEEANTNHNLWQDVDAGGYVQKCKHTDTRLADNTLKDLTK